MTVQSTQAHSAAGFGNGAPATARPLPVWPVAAAFAGFPLWWLLGLGDMSWPVFGIAMVYALARAGRARLPRGAGLWMLFLIWMTCSAIEIDQAVRLIGFFYRFLLYGAATIVFVYVYNARTALTERKVFGILTIFWLIVVVGGYAGIAFPVFVLRTPLSFVLPQSLLANSYVHDMAFRTLAQFNPEPNAYVIAAPRPSAPFLYTNDWGSVYSLLTPVAVAYTAMVRRQRRFWLLLAALPLSFIPAFLTLNRGMFLGLGVALVYVTLRAVLMGHGRIVLAVAAIAAIAGIAVTQLPVQARLEQRNSKVQTITDRSTLYQETFDRTLESPLFGYGAPRPSETTNLPSAGTQGQVWLVMFAHGFVGLGLFLGWLVLLFVRTVRRTDMVGLVCNTLILVALVEVFYYGMLGAGLVIIMAAGGLGMRRPEPGLEPGVPPADPAPLLRRPGLRPALRRW